LLVEVPVGLQHRIELGAYLLGSALLRALPLTLVQRLAAAAARAYFRLGGKRVRWTLVNLRFAYPELGEDAIARIGRDSFVHFAWTAIDLARSERWTDEDLRARIDLVGLEDFTKLLDRGRGAILLSLHLGSFDLALRLLSLELPDRGLAAVSRPLRNEYLARRLIGIRTEGGAELIPHKRVTARRMLRALRDGKPILVLNDQYSSRSRGVFVPLFGVRCSTSAGPATIALRAGVPVVPCYVIRDAPDHNTGYFLPPVEIEPSGDRSRDIEEATTQYNAVLEELIRRHPEQWLWGHRRFRHSPDLDTDPYS
jgi:KDO2-lipid IV(A) lauroyltransferase